MTCQELMTSPEACSEQISSLLGARGSLMSGLSVTPVVCAVEVCGVYLSNVQSPAATVGEIMCAEACFFFPV